MGTVIAVEGLGKRYWLGSDRGGYGRLTESLTAAVKGLGRRGGDGGRRDLVWALRDVSFSVDEGEIVGVVGRNGAGKTTLLKLLSRITDPTEGRAELSGRVGSLLEVGTGFHPELSGRENVYLNGAILGMARSEIRAKFDDIIGFAELERFVDTPVKRYSSGMYVRLAFAVAAFLEPEILFVDEVLSVGDQAFQQRCIGRMGEIASSGRTILFVSHNLASVSALCTRAILVDGGCLVQDGGVDEVVDHYLSTVQVAAGGTIGDRHDRQGNGVLRVIGITSKSEDGLPPRTGSDLIVRMYYECSVDGREITASLGVEGPLGEAVCYLSNRVTGERLVSRQGEAEIECRIPALPLLAGRYSLTVYIEVGGVLADWIRNAVFFDVYESDVFGTGQLPPATHGRFAVTHHWLESDDAS